MSGLSVSRIPSQRICSRCLSRATRPSSVFNLHRFSIHTKRELHGTIIPDNEVQKHMPIQAQSSFHEYFSANDTLDRGWLKNSILATLRTAVENPKSSSRIPLSSEATIEHTNSHGPIALDDGSKLLASSQAHSVTNNATTTTVEDEAGVLPHRRRLLRKARASKESQELLKNQQTNDIPLPLDASSRLATAAESLPTKATFRRRFATYLSLSKPRLSFLIILTTTSAYSLYPIPDILSSATSAVDATSTLSTSTLTLLFLTTGTFLSCASANTFNMLFEPKYDAMMTRTRNRPLVRKLITPRAALIFALVCGSAGLVLLDVGTNPTVAALSGLNILLYGFVYTPMKRISAANTWIGAIVGGIPPLMGWAAAAGQAATSENHSWKDLLLSESSVGGWLLAGLLFAWQFPHFNSLSHTIRDDYKKAGHKMLCWVNPARNARVALRYSIAMFPICAGLYWAGLVNQGFLVISTICNAWMTREAIRFWKYQGAKGSARGLFWASVWQLPLVLVGALVCKAGIWDGFFRKEPLSIYDIESDHTAVIDGEPLGMDTAQSTSTRKHEDRRFNMAMLGFKRPS